MKIIKKFYQFLWKYKGWLIAAVVTAIVASTIESLTSYINKLLIDNAVNKDYQQLLTFLGFWIGARLLGNWLGNGAILLSEKALIPAAKDARLRIFAKIQDLDLAYHVEKNTGALISAFKRGDSAFFDIFHAIHREILSVVVSFVVLSVFLSAISVDIIVILLIAVAVNLAVSWVLIGKNIESRVEFNKTEDEVSAIITDNLLNYETVKFFAQEKKEKERLATKFEDWEKKLWGFANSFRLVTLAVGTISAIAMFFILELTLRKLINETISVGEFIMVASFLVGFYYQFFMLVFQIRRIARNFVDLEKYLLILDEKEVVKDPARAKEIEEVKGKIEFVDVDFVYPKSRKQVLADVNLKIKAGESVAFVGRSGAGKTTIIKLLLRFYDATKGKIILDGVNIKRLKKGYLRSLIGVVPQEPILFNNTIGFNIGYGAEKASDNEIRQAAKAANLLDFIEGLPEKFETQVGERGIKLSGGQKQRLAIARAFLADPKIIVFDEATSNLDSESEELVQEALWNIAKKRTVLIIAHRFATIRAVDRIVVMEEGRVIESGSHQSLLRKKEGVYRRLWRLQNQGKLPKDKEGII